MGNRYTKTTLTAREINTMQGCLHKLSVIYERRKNNPNEDQDALLHLARSISNIYETIWRAEKLREN